MAVVTSITRNEAVAKLNPTETAASYKIGLHNGLKIIQIGTVGSKTRKIIGQNSQTMQFTAASAHQLYRILKSEFGFKD